MARKTLSDSEWAEIKHEYVTTDISGRDLAEKRGVPESTLFKRSSKEQWEAERKRHRSRLEAKLMQRDIDRKVNRASRIADAADLLLDKIEASISNAPILTPTAANNYSSALRNIKDVQMIRTAEDIEEQRARIEKLRRDTERGDQSATVVVTLEGGIDSYGG